MEARAAAPLLSGVFAGVGERWWAAAARARADAARQRRLGAALAPGGGVGGAEHEEEQGQQGQQEVPGLQGLHGRQEQQQQQEKQKEQKEQKERSQHEQHQQAVEGVRRQQDEELVQQHPQPREPDWSELPDKDEIDEANLSVGPSAGLTALVAIARGDREVRFGGHFNCAINYEHALQAALGAALAGARELEMLDMSCSGLGCAGLLELCAVLRRGGLPRLHTLGLDAHSFGYASASPDGGEELAAALAAGSRDRLRVLDLGNCALRGPAIVSLPVGRALSGLEWLRLAESPELGAEAGQALAKTLTLGGFPTLRTLDLSGAMLGPAAASALARALPLALNLRHLRLGRCRLGREGSYALFEALREHTASTAAATVEREPASQGLPVFGPHQRRRSRSLDKESRLQLLQLSRPPEADAALPRRSVRLRLRRRSVSADQAARAAQNTSPSARAAPQPVAAPSPAGLLVLDLAGNEQIAVWALAAVLADRAVSLQALSLSGCLIGPSQGATLGAGLGGRPARLRQRLALPLPPPLLPSPLRELDLSRNELGPAFARELALSSAQGSLAHLHTLLLDYNPLGAAGCSHVAALLLPGGAPLQTLSVAGCKAGPNGARAIKRVLLEAPNGAAAELRCLALQSNALGDAGALALAEALAHPALRLAQLDLSDNAIGIHGVRTMLAAQARSATLLCAELAGNVGYEADDSAAAELLRLRLAAWRVGRAGTSTAAAPPRTRAALRNILAEALRPGEAARAATLLALDDLRDLLAGQLAP
jgi:hypothetical protein